MAKKKRAKKAYAPKMSAEEYKEETGQRIGQKTGQGVSNVTKVDTTRTIIESRS